MRDEDDGDIFDTLRLLQEIADADVVFRKHPRDLGENTDFILNRQADIVATLEIGDKAHIFICMLGVLEGGIFHVAVRGCINDVGDDGAARRQVAGSAAVKHNISDTVAREEYCLYAASNPSTSAVGSFSA